MTQRSKGRSFLKALRSDPELRFVLLARAASGVSRPPASLGAHCRPVSRIRHRAARRGSRTRRSVPLASVGSEVFTERRLADINDVVCGARVRRQACLGVLLRICPTSRARNNQEGIPHRLRLDNPVKRDGKADRSLECQLRDRVLQEDVATSFQLAEIHLTEFDCPTSRFLRISRSDRSIALYRFRARIYSVWPSGLVLRY